MHDHSQVSDVLSVMLPLHVALHIWTECRLICIFLCACAAYGSESSLMVVQDHGLEAGLDIQLIPQCASALPEDPKTHPPQPVYLEMPVVNTNRYPCPELNDCLFGHFCAGLPKLQSDCCEVS